MLVHALEAKDAYTSGHSSRVSRYAVKTAVQLGLHRRAPGAHPPGRRAARHRQDRHPGGHPQQAGSAHARRVRAHQGTHRPGRADPGAVPRRVARSCCGSCARTTSGWTAAGFPTGWPGDAIPAGGAHRGGGRRLRRDDHQPRLPAVPDPGRRHGRAPRAAPARHFDPEVVERLPARLPRRRRAPASPPDARPAPLRCPTP